MQMYHRLPYLNKRHPHARNWFKPKKSPEVIFDPSFFTVPPHLMNKPINFTTKKFHKSFIYHHSHCYLNRNHSLLAGLLHLDFLPSFWP